MALAVHQVRRPHTEDPGGHVGTLDRLPEADELIGLIAEHRRRPHAVESLTVGDDPTEETMAAPAPHAV